MGSKLTLQKIAKECQRMVNLKQNTARIEERDISQIHSVRPYKEKYKCFFIWHRKIKKLQ